MSDEITQILERVDNELGRVKTAKREPPNLDEFFNGAELNNLADTCRKVLVALGKSDGTTAGSIHEKLLSFSGPRAETVRDFDDFIDSVIATAGDPGRYNTTLVGASAAALGIASTGSGSGAGHLIVLAAASASASALIHGAVDTLSGAHLPDVRFRFRTPTGAFADFDFWIGIVDVAGTSYARMRCDGSAVVRIQSASADGAGSVDTASALSLAADTWYDGRIVVTADQIDFYIGATLLGSITTAAAIPVAADPLTPFGAYCERLANGPHELVVDWRELHATRL